MRTLLIVLVFVGIASTAPTYQVQAQIPIAEIIKAAVKKVIKAVDWSQHGSTSYAL